MTFVIFGSVRIEAPCRGALECRLLRSRTYRHMSVRKYVSESMPSLRLEVNQVKDLEKEGD